MDEDERRRQFWLWMLSGDRAHLVKVIALRCGIPPEWLKPDAIFGVTRQKSSLFAKDIDAVVLAKRDALMQAKGRKPGYRLVHRLLNEEGHRITRERVRQLIGAGDPGAPPVDGENLPKIHPKSTQK
jgi:hypothetical protein